MSQPNPPEQHETTPAVDRSFLLLIGPILILMVVASVAIFMLIIRANNKDKEQFEDVQATVTSPDEEEAGLPEAVAVIPPLAPLGPVTFPDDNPYTEEKAELGRLLFFDTRMSGDGSLSCNSCHPASDGSWTIASPISFGYPGSTHWRNASTIINSAYYARLNWDGGKGSLEDQNKGAWTGAVGNNVDSAMAEERLAQIPQYVTLFNEVFGSIYPTFEQALMAVATFQRTIVSHNVPFDAYLNGDESALSESAVRGYELFTGDANCIACHNGALISDDSFHNTGVPNAPEFSESALNQITFRYEQWAKGVTEEDYDTAVADMGLYYVTKQSEDIGKFRTPSLRDLCYTAPYMHNGVFDTLEEVVEFYDEGAGTHQNLSPLLFVLDMTPQQQSDLVAFLESLCGDTTIVTAPELPPYEAVVRGED